MSSYFRERAEKLARQAEEAKDIGEFDEEHYNKLMYSKDKKKVLEGMDYYRKHFKQKGGGLLSSHPEREKFEKELEEKLYGKHSRQLSLF